MIMERTLKSTADNYNNFGEAMPDGRLTEQSDGNAIKLREAIVFSKQLGRPLTNAEMDRFKL